MNESLPTIEQVVGAHVRRVLTSLDWNLSQAAKVLDVDRRTVYRLMKRHQIERPACGSDPA